MVESMVIPEPTAQPPALIDPNAQDEKKKAEALVQSQAPRSASVEIEADRAKAEALSSTYVALQYPRKLAQCKEAVMQFCKDPAFAERAVTARPDHKDKPSASIRLMEVIAINWGNLEYGVFVHGQNREQSDLEVFCKDLQNNSRFTNRFVMKHERQSGDKLEPVWKPTSVGDLQNAAISNQLKKVLKRVIPAPIVKEFERVCLETVANSIKDVESKKLALLKGFKESYGVSELSVQRYLKKPLKDIDKNDVLELWQIYLAIRDEGHSASEWFEVDANKIAKPEADKPATGEKTKDQEGAKNDEKPAATKGGKPAPKQQADSPKKNEQALPEQKPSSNTSAETIGQTKPGKQESADSTETKAEPPKSVSVPSSENTGTTEESTTAKNGGENSTIATAAPASDELDSIWG